MVRNRRCLISALAALMLALICAGCYAHAQTHWVLALPSGESVTIVHEEHQSFENVDHVQKRILAIGYMTDHPITDEENIKMEARRVFAAYKTRIDVSDFNTVTLAAEANDDAGGIEGRPYYFERYADGTWYMLP
jgi:hypothetical protein